MSGRSRAPETGGCDAGHAHAFGSDFDPHLTVTVIYTTHEGTRTALRTAAALANDLGARIGLVATLVVPFRLPLEEPPVSTSFLQQRRSALVAEAAISPEEVTVQICLCRDQRKALAQFLAARSLIVLGGNGRWWRPECRLAKWLSRLGHQVVFSETERKAKSFFSRILTGHTA
jgi:hypothetical protein